MSKEDLSSGLAMEMAQRSVLAQVYKREGETLTFDPATLSTPLSDVLDNELHVTRLLGELDEETRHLIEERLDVDLEEWLYQVRSEVLQVLLDFLFGGDEGPLPRKVLKRLFAFVRVLSPNHVWCMTQTDVGRLFNETRANVQAREKAEVESFYRLWCTSKWTASGGKSASARERYARDKRGNDSRKGGKKFRHLLEQRETDEAHEIQIENENEDEQAA